MTIQVVLEVLMYVTFAGALGSWMIFTRFILKNNLNLHQRITCLERELFIMKNPQLAGNIQMVGHVCRHEDMA